MTDEEQKLHYQPPAPPPPRKPLRKTGWMHWTMVMCKDWEKGEAVPEDPARRFTGNLRDFHNMTGEPLSNIYILVATYEGDTTYSQDRQTVKGWRIRKLIRNKAPKRKKVLMSKAARQKRKDLRLKYAIEFKERHGMPI